MRLARERIHFQGLPARICWLGYGERAEFGLAINDYVRTRKDRSAHRDRARSSGCRLGGFALSRNRSHARRLRRHRRLAAAQCAAEHRGGRVLGFDSQRRRRGNRLRAACRHGGGGRWNRSLRPAPGARAHHRSRPGRDSPRRRRLSARPSKWRARKAFACRWIRRGERARGRQLLSTGDAGRAQPAAHGRRNARSRHHSTMAPC